MKRNFVIAVLNVLIIMIISTGAFAAEKVTARVSACNSMTHPQTIGLLVMKQYVEDKTDGNFVINIFPNSQLGAEEESLAQVQTGSLEMATASIGPVTTFQKKFFALDIPFLFTTYNEAWMVMDSKVGQELLASLEECGMKGLAYMENGYRHVTSSVKPIHQLGDFKGLKIRTMQAPMHMLNFQTLGANPTPVPFSELYLSMQQKIVDGQENPIANMWDLNMYEVQKYVSLTGHIYDAMPLVANLRWFEKLPTEYQEALAVGAILGQNYSRFVNAQREDLILKELEKRGMSVNTLDEAALAEIQKVAQPAVTEKVKEEAGAEFIDNFLKDIENVKADVVKGMN